METAYVAVRTQVLGDGPFVGPDLTQFAALKEVLEEVREKGEQQDERPESVGAEVMVEEGPDWGAAAVDHAAAQEEEPDERNPWGTGLEIPPGSLDTHLVCAHCRDVYDTTDFGGQSLTHQVWARDPLHQTPGLECPGHYEVFCSRGCREAHLRHEEPRGLERRLNHFLGLREACDKICLHLYHCHLSYLYDREQTLAAIKAEINERKRRRE